MSKKNWIGIAVLGLLVIGSACVPLIVMSFERNRLIRIVSAGKQVFIAMQEAELDRKQNGSGVGYPAESGAHSTKSYLELLVQHGYLTREDLALFGGLVITNVSEDDPPNTIIMISRPYYEYLTQGARFPKGYVVIRNGGDAQSGVKPISLSDFPRRTPSVLQPD